MNSDRPASQAPPDDGVPNTETAAPFPARRRPARALLGWIKPEAARALMTSSQDPTEALPFEDRRRLQSMNSAVAARAPVSASMSADVVGTLPPGLEAHCAKLASNPHAAAMLAEGWQVQLVDLRAVRAFQPVVFTDSLEERFADFDSGDLESIARVTLPPEHAPTNLPVSFDESQQAWVVASSNPNLRVAGSWAGQLPLDGVPPGLALAFVVMLSPSFMQVAGYNGHWFLRDGYHRAFGLLERGVTHAPVFVRSLEAYSDLGVPVSHLPQEAFLGQRPPLLPDYLDDTVSAPIEGFATTRVITVAQLQTSIIT